MKKPDSSGKAYLRTLQTWSSLALQISLRDWLLIVVLIFGGCCSNVFTLEVLVGGAKKSGNLVTCAQFLFVSLDGLMQHIDIPKGSYLPRLKERKVPVHVWLIMVVLFFSLSVMNNLALGYHISVPLHIIFRSAGLMFNMILGWLVLNKRYSAKQIVAVILISIGVTAATLSSADTSKGVSHDQMNYSDWMIGVSLLLIAIVLSSLLGLYQEVTYKKYGNQWRESLFYTHFFSLPFFALFYRDILEQIQIYIASEPMKLSQVFEGLPLHGIAQLVLGDVACPKLLLFLVFNILTQYVCISGVHRLTGMATSLTLNLVLTLRKLVSLVISVWYFDNELSFEAMVGCSMVFLGTVLYSLGSRSQQKPKQKTT
ncbi:UAA transporter [Basidiobolus meristosporus CBS 931.73]|uniref:UAA transporter n=1 Tax=Basidiobolus meristosporus CBS 931.73 TaxID=1314790 RepID=A0A1Y1Y096_9FUNG|nr:UAA transporter [Basidiobolus meristosporus CBS 931.73]|eukprot:ORX91430.1 UAA transporter [Basidiobolus meristosporus CBS 931.73]